MTVKNVGIIAKTQNPHTITLSKEVAQWLKDRGINAYMEKELAVLAKHDKCFDCHIEPEEVDFILALGGDGTMLFTVRLLQGKPIPIVGVNLGGLGFLTQLKKENMYMSLDDIIGGDVEIEDRMMLDVIIERDGKEIGSHKVLNDIVLKGELARLARFKTHINNEHMATYRADGLIIATPTGSTAYALSADGPILYPTIHSIIIVPICPFNLTNRPVVIPDWMGIEIYLDESQKNTQLTLDGYADIILESSDTVKIRRSKSIVRLFKVSKQSYFEVLRERFSWELGEKK